MTEEDYIHERYWQNFNLFQESIRSVLTFLLLTNSGGAIAVASFLGTSQFRNQTDGPVWALVLYVAGIILAGILLAARYRIMNNIFEGWRADSQSFRNKTLNWNTLNDQDDERSRPRNSLNVLGYSSFGCFIIGSLIAASSLISLDNTDVSSSSKGSSAVIQKINATAEKVSTKERAAPEGK